MADKTPNASRFARDQQRRITEATAIGMNVLKPIMHFQVSMLRMLADSIERFVGNYERGWTKPRPPSRNAPRKLTRMVRRSPLWGPLQNVGRDSPAPLPAVKRVLARSVFLRPARPTKTWRRSPVDRHKLVPDKTSMMFDHVGFSFRAQERSRRRIEPILGFAQAKGLAC